MTVSPSSDEAIAEIMQGLRRVFRTIHDYYREVSKKWGITGPQLWLLKILANGEPMRHGELSKKMYLHPSTISGVVDRLEKKGYVTRVRDHEDRRVVKVELTYEGRRLAEKAPNPIQGKMVYGLSRLKREELKAVFAAVEKLVEIAEARNVKATFFFGNE
jgi:DNA-binding MarR family transcriptional regulator